MNKFVISIAIVAILAIAFGTVNYVSAQTPTPQAPVPGSGYGMMGGRGARGGMAGQPSGFGMGIAANGVEDGVLHDALVAIYAEKLGISVEDLNARLEKGETLAQIATAKGLTIDEFRTLMVDAHNQAVALAVKNGTLTQEQAEWMNQRGAGMMSQAPAARSGVNGARGFGSRGAVRNQNPMLDCPLVQPAQ